MYFSQKENKYFLKKKKTIAKKIYEKGETGYFKRKGSGG